MVKSEPEITEFNPEWLVRKGNYVTLITPELATQLLERNTANRRKKTKAIAKYARDMADGHWDPDASDIKIATTGELIDGQNRLYACQQAGVPFPTLLRTGCKPSAKSRVDQGVRRTLADQLIMHNATNATATAAAINLRARYELGLEEYEGKQTLNDRKLNMTHDEALAYLAEHPTLDEFTPIGRSLVNVAPAIPGSVFIAALSWYAEIDDKAARRFADAILHGESTGTGDPLLAFTRYSALARQNKMGNPGNRGRVTAQKHMLAFTRVWNAWRKDDRLESLMVRATDRLVRPE